MKLCKSEGLKGNTEALLHSRAIHRDHRKYHVRQATSAYHTPKSQCLFKLVPLKLPLFKIKLLKLIDNTKIKYGFVNRRDTNRRTLYTLRRGHTLPPYPRCLAAYPPKNIFRNLGGSNVH